MNSSIMKDQNSWIVRYGGDIRPAESNQGIDLVRELSEGGKKPCAYTVLRTLAIGEALEIAVHVDRLETSARFSNITPFPTNEMVSSLLKRAQRVLGVGTPALVVLAMAEGTGDVQGLPIAADAGQL